MIRIVEKSHLPAGRNPGQLVVAHGTFCRRHDGFPEDGPEALEDRASALGRVWNRTPERIGDQIIKLALERPGRSPRGPAVRFSDERHQFVSEATVCRLRVAHDLTISPA